MLTAAVLAALVSTAMTGTVDRVEDNGVAVVEVGDELLDVPVRCLAGTVAEGRTVTFLPCRL